MSARTRRTSCPATPPIAHERAGRAIEDQVAAGGRARKANPKRKALTELGDEDAEADVARTGDDRQTGQLVQEISQDS